MSDATKRILARYAIAPLAVAVAAYYLLAQLAAKVMHIPAPEIKSLLMMIPSRLADFLDITFFKVSLPAERAADITAQTGLTELYLHVYFHFADAIHGGWIYRYFPAFFLTAAVVFGIYAMAKMAQLGPEQQRKKQKYLRGTRKVDASAFVNRSHKVRDPATVLRTKDGKLVISDKKIREHTLILGSTGSGKSQLILNYLRDMTKPGSDIRLVCVDRKGELYAHFAHDGDILFHPYDRRGVRWNIFNEINLELDAGQVKRMPPDIKAITSILFQLQNQKGENVFWYKSAASVANSALCYCILNHRTTTADLLQVLNSDAPTLAAMFETLPPALQAGRAAMGDPKGKQAGSVLSICTGVMDCLESFSGKDGAWSCRDWINSGTGNLFLSVAGKNDTIFTSLIGLVIDLIGRELKQFKDDGQGTTRFLFVIDELGSYPPLQTLIWLLTLGRSKGVGVIIANQTVSKLKKIYGAEECYNLLSNTKTKYIFQLPEPSDAEYAAKMIGTSEVERETRSENRGAGLLGRAHGDSNTAGKQITQDVPFFASDIQNLKVGQAITVEPNLLPAVALMQYLPVTDCPARRAEFEPAPVDEITAAAMAAMQQAEPPAESAHDEQKQVQPERMQPSSTPETPKSSVMDGLSREAMENQPLESPTSPVEDTPRPATLAKNGENPAGEDTDEDPETDAGDDWTL